MFVQKWHVERAKQVKDSFGEIYELFYDIKNDFSGYAEAETYFNTLMPIPGEKAYLEYSDNDQAVILAIARY